MRSSPRSGRDLPRDTPAMLSQTAAIGVHEALRRPGFHALRIVSMAGVYAIDGESSDPLYESIEDPQDLPPALQARGAALAARLKLPLHIEMAAIQALFLAALVVGLRRRNWAILALFAAVLLKYVFHVFGVFQGRYFMVATALEILTIAVAVEEVLKTAPPARRSLLARSVAVGAAFGLALWIVPPRMLAFVHTRDIDPQQHTYHFFLQPPDHPCHQSFAHRTTRSERLLAGYTIGIDAMLFVASRAPYDPSPGKPWRVAECVLTGRGGENPGPWYSGVFDPLPADGLAGRHECAGRRLDGEEVYYQDLGQEPGSGWANIPLGNVGVGTRRRVVVELQAIHPEAGANWGWNSRTSFRLARSSSALHLAMARPTAQSSTLDYDTAGSRAAVDGNTGGNFFHDSVTSTNLDPHAWWQVDLGSSKAIGSIVIWNRTDCCSSRLSDYWVFISDTPFGRGDSPATLQNRAGTWKSHQTTIPDPSTTIGTPGAKGRYVRVQLTGTGYLSLAEVQVSASGPNLAAGKPATQSSTLSGYSTAGCRQGSWMATSTATFPVAPSRRPTRTPTPGGRWTSVLLQPSAPSSSGTARTVAPPVSVTIGSSYLTPHSAPATPPPPCRTVPERGRAIRPWFPIPPPPSQPPAQKGRYVRVQLAGTDYLSLAEVQVFGQ